MNELETIAAKLRLCSALSSSRREGALQLVSALRQIGGTILEIRYGDVHDSPESDIDDGGSIIVRLGLEHPALVADVHPHSKSCGACGSWGYIHASRSFDFNQFVDASQPQLTDQIAKGVLAFTLSSYSALQPCYGWIDEPGENEPSTKSIRDADLRYLFWANFFGPEAVKKWGREFLLRAPGWRKDELDNGGVLYVVEESYAKWMSTDAKASRAYFRTKAPSIEKFCSHGFDRLEDSVASGRRHKRRRTD